MQVQHGSRRQVALGIEERALEALEVKGGELRKPDLSEGGDGMAPDEVLVAVVGGCPDPAPCVGEPFL